MLFRPEDHSGSSTGTWLAVHGGNIDLKSSNVGHQEGQSSPVEHLRGGNVRGDAMATPPGIRPLLPRHERWKLRWKTHLYLYDLVKEDLRSLLKLKLEVLKEQNIQRGQVIRSKRKREEITN